MIVGRFDRFNFYPRPPGGGRHSTEPNRQYAQNFYPRPPGGGRQKGFWTLARRSKFLSTPSGWRATLLFVLRLLFTSISIHALRVEGDARYDRAVPLRSCYFYPRPPGGGRHSKAFIALVLPSVFLSTPSGWRATAKTDKVFVCFCAKGRRICLFKTRKEKICRWRFKKDKFWVLIWCEGSGKSVCASASHCG